MNLINPPRGNFVVSQHQKAQKTVTVSMFSVPLAALHNNYENRKIIDVTVLA